MALVTKMHASLQKLAHSDIGQCHWPACSFFRFCRREVRNGPEGLSPERAQRPKMPM
jgi:hypothetical protein